MSKGKKKPEVCFGKGKKQKCVKLGSKEWAKIMQSKRK